MPPRVDPTSAVDLDATVDDGRGHKLSWRRINANAEGRVDLSAIVGGDVKPGEHLYLYAPLVSPVAQTARLVIDTPAEAAAWVNGKPVTFSAAGGDKGMPRTADLELSQATGGLLIRMPLAAPGGAGPRW